MPDSAEALDQLAACDPARTLAPLGSVEREAIRNAILGDVSSAALPATAGQSRRRFTRRSVRVGPFVFAPAALLAAFAATALAAGALITVTATTVFRTDEQGLNFNGDIEKVLPSTVHQIGTVTIPDYGQVEAWGATTKPGGFCFALRMPDGSWGGYPVPKTSPASGWDGGTVPGCFQTQQQQTIKLDQPPTGLDGQYLPLEAWDSTIANNAGEVYSVWVGYVEAQGVAATVLDPETNTSAPVNRDGYYVLAEKSPTTAAPPHMPAGYPSEVTCGSCDYKDLEALNAAGQPLRADFKSGAMLPGYSPGPTQGSS